MRTAIAWAVVSTGGYKPLAIRRMLQNGELQAASMEYGDIRIAVDEIEALVPRPTESDQRVRLA